LTVEACPQLRNTTAQTASKFDSGEDVNWFFPLRQRRLTRPGMQRKGRITASYPAEADFLTHFRETIKGWSEARSREP
jgi:hypothetical protein